MNTRPASTVTTFDLGAAAADRRLTSGLVRGAVHEIYAAPGDGATAAGFALMLAIRAAADRPIIVIRDDASVGAHGRIYGCGIADFGGDPGRLIVVHARDALAALRATGDAVACAAVGAVVVEPWAAATPFDLTASRRLALRAERSGVMTVIVRSGDPVPSAAATRWRVAAAPSTPMAGGAPGPPAFAITLLRHRGGIAGFDARVEWNRDDRRFDDWSSATPLPWAAPAMAAGGTREPQQRRAA